MRARRILPIFAASRCHYAFLARCRCHGDVMSTFRHRMTSPRILRRLLGTNITTPRLLSPTSAMLLAASLISFPEMPFPDDHRQAVGHAHVTGSGYRDAAAANNGLCITLPLFDRVIITDTNTAVHASLLWSSHRFHSLTRCSTRLRKGTPRYCTYGVEDYSRRFLHRRCFSHAGMAAPRRPRRTIRLEIAGRAVSRHDSAEICFGITSWLFSAI